jgi:oligopeptide transport system substrate-binding protein
MKTLPLLITAVMVLSSGLTAVSCDNGRKTTTADTLNLYGVDPYTLDPALSGDNTSHQYIIQMFSGLVRLDNDLQVSGDIADHWEVSDDGTTYTFYLRQDVLFHDGKQLTADDFKASWERACSPEIGSQTAPLYLGDILGARQVIDGEAEEISGVRVVDKYTLEIILEEPRSYFLYKLAYPTAFVVDTETAVGSSWWRSGVNGTGPFKLEEWKQGNRLELVRYDRYYGKVADLGRVVYHLWAGTVMDLYETGQIDVAEIGEDYVDKVTDEKNEFFDELVTIPVPSLTYIGFNVNEAPFDDPLIRKAFAMAIDMDRVVGLVYRGSGVVVGSVIPPGIPGYSQTIAGTGFDPDAAQDIISMSSYGSVDNLPAITLTTGGYGGFIPNELQAIVYQWEENMGIEVIVRQIEPNEYYYNLMAEKDELFYFGWVADYPHPQNFLEVLFGSSSVSNIGEYHNSHFDALIATAGEEQDSISSIELYQQAEAVLMEDAALIPISFGTEMILVKPYVHGYNPNPLGGVALNEVWLEGK